jgi:hypothetical protein
LWENITENNFKGEQQHELGLVKAAPLRSAVLPPVKNGPTNKERRTHVVVADF